MPAGRASWRTTASTTPLPRSWTSSASNCLRTSSTRSGVVDSDIGLRPRLGEAFGGSTGLGDVGIGRSSHDQALFPNGDNRKAKLDPTGPPVVVDHRQHSHEPGDRVGSRERVAYAELELPRWHSAAEPIAAPVSRFRPANWYQVGTTGPRQP